MAGILSAALPRVHVPGLVIGVAGPPLTLAEALDGPLLATHGSLSDVGLLDRD